MYRRFRNCRGSMSLRPRARVVAIMTIAAVIVGLTPRAALAWKPYTHNYTGSQVQADLGDGRVSINGREYAVDGRVNSAAINTWPAYYNAMRLHSRLMRSELSPRRRALSKSRW
jgi:hypothetical protein